MLQPQRTAAEVMAADVHGQLYDWHTNYPRDGWVEAEEGWSVDGKHLEDSYFHMATALNL